ncbi:cysteine hydrolase family protein [Aciduricibacillus chroicocephali]|uniref:Cysteine hydrolase family protein n=1 Tax=Aciduricibacillus chroicocephali TaxID=3054939 RepID=A0ABY9KX45_9BACI|nr:cysteine hydrolase family protein [Bacillaceae bacterium 44XB]
MTNEKALILVDVQQGFDDPKWGTRNNLHAEENIAQLLAYGREQDWLIIHAQHLSKEECSPLHPAKPGVAFKQFAQPLPHEKIVQKHVNSAFIGTDLEVYLREHSIEKNIIVGLTTPHCVSTTARMSGNLGFATIVVEDATAAFPLMNHKGQFFSAEVVHENALASLCNEFAEIKKTKDLIK